MAGASVGAQDGAVDVVLLEPLNEVLDLLVHRLIRPWLWYNPIYKLTSSGRKFRKYMELLRSFLEKIIQRRKESPNKIREDNAEHYQFENDKSTCLDILLEEHFKDASLTLEDIQGQMLSILFAGYDTTTTLSWALCLLGHYPEVQDKVFQELNFIFGSNKTREVTLGDLNDMIYSEQVLKETLRLYPPAPIIGRKNKESIQIGTRIIPPKSHILILIYMLHKTPDVFPNPEKFDPDRFSAENMATRDTYSFMPFSLGPRKCIGHLNAMTQMKIILCH
ncbi:Cytochrome P450 4C1, partial [Stegodyphus mimosarum]